MNPHHLDLEELDYEISIRKITGIDGIDNKKRALRRRLKDEVDHPSEVPQITHTQDILLDFGPKVELLQNELKSAFKQNDINKLFILKSRLIHWSKRLGRISIESDDNMTIYKAYQTSIIDYLSAINDLKVITKSKKNTKTTSLDDFNILPLPSDQSHDLLSSSRIEGAESLEKQGFQNLTEKERHDLDKAHKLIEELTRKSQASVLDMSYNLENMSISNNNNLTQKATPVINPVTEGRPSVSSSESEDELILNQNRNRNRRNQRDQMPVHYFKRGLPVSRWAVKFSGDSKGLKLPEFLNQVDILATAEGATDQELIRSAIYLFEGFAKTWYMAFRRNYLTWTDLVIGLKTQFLPKDYDYWQMKDIENRLQRTDESFGVFLAAMELMFHELPYITAERQKVAIIRRNLLPAYQDRLALVDTHTVAQLTFACDRMEQSQYAASRRLQQQQPTISQARPERVSVPILDSSMLKCYNCKKSGHHFNDCKIPLSLFCFRCGKDKVSSLNCPNCVSKNVNRGPC